MPVSMKLEIAVLLTIHGLCTIERVSCDSFKTNSPARGWTKDEEVFHNHQFPSPVYVITPLNYNDDVSGIITKWSARFPFEVSAELPVTFRFQLWEKGDSDGKFIFRGENVFTCKKMESFMQLYPNDPDQLTIKGFYYVGFYANGPTYFIYENSTCSSGEKMWTSPVTDPSHPLSFGAEVTFQQYGDGTECLGFAYEAVGTQVDLSCKQENLTKLDGEGFIEINPKDDIKDLAGDQPDQCWIIRIQRPCTSSVNFHPSVQIVEPKNCQDIHNFEFHDGGTRAYPREMRCRYNVPTFSGSSEVFYFQYKVNEGHHFDHVKLRYYIDLERAYLTRDTELCEGESLSTIRGNSTAVIVGAVIAMVFIIVFVIAVIVQCNKVKTQSSTSDGPSTDSAAARVPLQSSPGQQVHILPMQGPGTQPQVVYYPHPLNTTTQPAYTTQDGMEPQTPPPAYTTDDTAPLDVNLVEI